MTHRERLVAVIKSQGKILREDNGAVTLPFGAEYSVLIKNLDSVRIMVKVSIDGVDATGGTRLIVPPNSDLEFERFIRNGNLAEGNRFKFIERTAQIEEHRGIKADDGLVRIESWAEMVTQFVPTVFYQQPTLPRRRRWDDRGATWTSGIARGSLGPSGQSQNTIYSRSMGVSQETQNFCSALNDQGITVAGSTSNQTFISTSGFPLQSTSTVIVLRLRGVLGNVLAQEPITVQNKPRCVTCGRVNKGTSKFCSNCGTALVIL